MPKLLIKKWLAYRYVHQSQANEINGQQGAGIIGFSSMGDVKQVEDFLRLLRKP